MIIDNLTSTDNAPSNYRAKKYTLFSSDSLGIKLLSALVVGSTSALTAGIIASTVFNAAQVILAAIIGGLLGVTLIASCWVSRAEPRS